MKKLILSIVMMLATLPVFAAGGQWTAVTVAHVWGCGTQNCTNQQMQVQFSAASTTTQNGCVASSYHTWAVVDLSTAEGAFTASLLQSAFMLQSTITVYGTNTCTIVSNMENVAWVQE